MHDSDRATTALDPDTAPGAVAHMFNSALAASALGSAWQMGMLDEVSEAGSLDLADFAERNKYDLTTLQALSRVLALRGIVEYAPVQETTLVPGPLLAEARRNIGFFGWLSGGYGGMLSRLPELVRRPDLQMNCDERDSRAVAMASQAISSAFVDETFVRVLDDLPYESAADLGCGNGMRLAGMVASRGPTARGVGVDVSQPALRAAGEIIEEQGLADRVSLVNQDVRNLEPSPQLAGIELVTMFMMGHDLWPREQCVRSLRRLRAAFPDMRYMVFADTCRTPSGSPDPEPIFNLGFELTHAVMGQYLPTLAEWRSIWPEVGLRPIAEHRCEQPQETYLFVLRAEEPE